jgi:hypothetical protein
MGVEQDISSIHIPTDGTYRISGRVAINTPATVMAAAPSGSMPFGTQSAYNDTLLGPPSQLTVTPSTCFNLSLFKGEQGVPHTRTLPQ